MSARERREARLWTPLSIVVLVGGWLLFAAIEGEAVSL